MNIYAFADETHEEVDLQIRAMLRNHLQGLEIRSVDGENVSKISLEKAKEVRKKMDDAGLITWSIGSPIGKFYVTPNADYEGEKDKLKHTLEVAEILGAGNLRMFSGRIPKGDAPEAYRSLVFELLAEYIEIAKPHPVTLCHENEKGIYGDNAIRTAEILTAFPEIHGIFDPANFVQVGQDTLEAWKLLKNRIRYMHIKDAFSDGKVVPPGCGEGHLPEIVREFVAMGGKDFTMEPHLHAFSSFKTLEEKGQESLLAKEQYVYESGDAALDAAVRYFRQILETIG